MEINATSIKVPNLQHVRLDKDGFELFTIENANGTKVVACNYGAALVSIFVKDKRGYCEDVVLGYADPSDYLTDEFYIGTVVGRHANRIAGAQVRIDEKVYKLSENKPGFHTHGGFQGFNKKLFSVTSFANQNGSGVVFTYTSADLEEGYPGELKLEVIYTLDNEDALTLEYKASADKTTIVNLTQHSYFNLSGNLSETVYNHELKIFSKYYLPVNQIQVPTGELKSVTDTVFDFTEYKKIGADILSTDEQIVLSKGFDHSFVLEQQHTNQLKHAASVREPVSGRKMDVYTTEPSVHFYSGNYLDNVKGKNGIVYNQRCGFCLETQHFPDAPNHPHFPSIILEAGERFYSKTIFKFGVE